MAGAWQQDTKLGLPPGFAGQFHTASPEDRLRRWPLRHPTRFDRYLARKNRPKSLHFPGEAYLLQYVHLREPVTTSSVTESRLLKLPAELRTMIYEYAMPSPALTRVNRQLRAEVFAVMRLRGGIEIGAITTPYEEKDVLGGSGKIVFSFYHGRQDRDISRLGEEECDLD